MASDVSKSWFCVFNNPRENGYDIQDNDVLLETVAYDFIGASTTRVCALTLCISAEGLEHIHAVFEDVIAFRFSALKKIFPKMHIEATKGNKKQAEDYINKVGNYAEKGEVIIAKFQHGDIQGRQGQRFDLSEVQNLIKAGMTPKEIFDLDIKYRRWEKIIKDVYFAKRVADTPVIRDVNVEWHFGATGTGKSYTYVAMCEQYGRDDIYVVNDYDTGFLDNYFGQAILFLDEFRSQIPYGKLLSMLDSYVREFHARYTNVVGLWNTVIITSPFAPEQSYNRMVKEDEKIDAREQLFRRINKVVYHYKDESGYHIRECAMNEYVCAAELIKGVKSKDGFVPVDNKQLPWDL